MGNEHAVTQELDEFASGFAGQDIIASTTTPTDDDDASDLVGETLPVVTKPAVADGEVVPAPGVPAEEPKMHPLTESDYANLMNAVKSIEDFKGEATKKFDTAFGKIGGMDQLVRQTIANTPRGKVPKVSAEDFGENATEYPRMTENLVEGLNKMFSKFEGTGTAEIDPAFIESKVKEGVAAALPLLKQQLEQDRQTALVTEAHPDREEVFKHPDFQAWVNAQPDAERKLLNETWDAKVLVSAISKYKNSKKPAQPAAKTAPSKPNIRSEALRSAVNPRSENASPNPAAKEDDFEAGFNSPD